MNSDPSQPDDIHAQTRTHAHTDTHSHSKEAAWGKVS